MTNTDPTWTCRFCGQWNYWNIDKCSKCGHGRDDPSVTSALPGYGSLSMNMATIGQISESVNEAIQTQKDAERERPMSRIIDRAGITKHKRCKASKQRRKMAKASKRKNCK